VAVSYLGSQQRGVPLAVLLDKLGGVAEDMANSSAPGLFKFERSKHNAEQLCEVDIYYTRFNMFALPDRSGSVFRYFFVLTC
jgi:hypothetical protein